MHAQAIEQSTSDSGGPTQEWQRSLVDAFTERARAAATQVSVVGSTEEAADVIASSPTRATAGRYTTSAALVSAFPALPDALQLRNIQLRVAEELAATLSSPSDVAGSLAGDTGLLLAHSGVAETGSFLSADDSLPARLVGMLSDTAYAILPASVIVPSLDEISPILSQLTAQGKRYLSLVTGPSRTADIERVLTIGVQGPKLLHVIVIRNE